MSKFKIKFFYTLLTITILVLAPTVFVFGQGSDIGQVASDIGQLSSDIPGGDLQTFHISNPIKADNFEQFLSDILSIIVQIGVPVLVLMTIYTGFKFVAAKGNPGDLTKARSMLVNLIVGAFIVLGCFAISEALQNTVSQLGPITVPNSFKQL
jgi:hypothetical protein